MQSQLNNSTSDLSYEDKIGLMLLELKVDEPFLILNKVNPENREKFINIVKSYIDRNFGHREGVEIIFSNDYSNLKKKST